ncbi:hypothetical protein [Aquimarina algiphila]|uniref:hypothetical protein n=1 Tax=Aquimarina algiphila TaxID=2047982 RepID=UPI00232D4EEA|nr:hypothetical protein [Aquimarina algiphila]
MKKVVFIINILAFAITLIGHMLSGFGTMKYELYGLISQFCLGVIQIVMGLGFFIRWEKHSLRVRRGLLIYWGIVVAYFFIGIQGSIDDVILFGVMPMSIAAYFTAITFFNIKNKIADILSINS